MSKLTDLLDAFKYNPDTFNEDEFKAALRNAATEDESTWNAAVTTKDSELAKAREELVAAKNDNWTLFKKLGDPITPNNAGGSTVPPVAGEGDPNEPELKGTSSFFQPIKKE